MKKIIKVVGVLAVVLVSVLSLNLGKTNAQTVQCPVGYVCTNYVSISNLTKQQGTTVYDSSGRTLSSYPSFTFTVNNLANFPIYISKNPSLAISTSTSDTSYSSTTVSSVLVGGSTSGDTANAYIVNSSRTFTYNMVSNSVNSLNGVRRIAITAVEYGIRSDTFDHVIITDKGFYVEVPLGASDSNNQPTITARLSPANPPERTINTSTDQKDVTFGVFSLKSANVSGTLQSIAFKIVASSTQAIRNFRLYSGSTLIAAESTNSGIIKFTNLTIPLPADVWNDLRLVGDVNAGANGSAVVSFDGTLTAISANFESIKISVPSVISATPLHFSTTGTTKPSITIISPKPGDVWEVGKTYTVSWETTGNFETNSKTQLFISEKDSSLSDSHHITDLIRVPLDGGVMCDFKDIDGKKAYDNCVGLQEKSVKVTLPNTYQAGDYKLVLDCQTTNGDPDCLNRDWTKDAVTVPIRIKRPAGTPQVFITQLIPEKNTAAFGDKKAVFASFDFDASQSSTDVLIPIVSLSALRGNLRQLNNCNLYSGDKLISGGQTGIGNPDIRNDYHFYDYNNQSSGVIIKKGNHLKVDLKCDVTVQSIEDTYDWFLSEYNYSEMWATVDGIQKSFGKTGFTPRDPVSYSHTLYSVQIKKVGTNPLAPTPTPTNATDVSATLNSKNLELVYSDSPTKEEAILKSTFTVTENGGPKGVYIYKGYADVVFFDQNGNRVNINSQSFSVVPSVNLPIVTGEYGNELYFIPAGTNVKFTITSSVNPKQMFAGTYYASLKSVFANTGLKSRDFTTIPMPANKTNSVTIIGEKSPYITSVSDYPSIGSTFIISGVRLGTVGKTSIFIDGQIFPLIGPIKQTQEEISFVLTNFPSLNTQSDHYIYVVDSVTGRSNTMVFHVGSTKGLPPKIPTTTPVPVTPIPTTMPVSVPVTQTYTPTVTSTPTPTATPTTTVSPSPTTTVSPSPTTTVTPRPSPTATASPSPTGSPRASATTYSAAIWEAIKSVFGF